jgi:hypothetical protein
MATSGKQLSSLPQAATATSSNELLTWQGTGAAQRIGRDTFVGSLPKYRQKSTAYAVGDIVYPSAVSMQKLVCVVAGTTGSSSISYSSTEGALTTDGSVVWQTDSLADGNYTAMHQNGIAGGRDITAYWNNGYMSTNIRAGVFVGMHIGDYIIKTVFTPETTYTDKAGASVTQAAATYSNVKWLIGAFDPHIHCGDIVTTAHHVLLIPNTTLQRNVSMNPTNDTTGGYLGSDMWTVHMPIWSTAIKAAFGATHVLSYREILSNAINATAPSGAGAGLVGTASDWVWTDVEVNIPNEQMIYGGRVSGGFYDGGDWPQQLPLFAFKQYVGGDERSWYWLRAVASASRFAYAGGNGVAYAGGASQAVADGGIRPYFLLY